MSYRMGMFAAIAAALMIAALACWMLLAGPSPPEVTLSFTGYSTNSSAQTLASFTFTNGSKYTIVAPDSCCIQFQGDNKFTMIHFHDIRLPSGYRETFSLAPPAGKRPWRLGISQYPEDEGKLNDIWEGADPKFRNASTKQKYDDFMGAVHRKLGKVTSTSNTNWRVQNFNLKTTVLMSQNTTFENGQGTESFAFLLDGTNAVLVGYNIQSMDLITK